MIRREGRLRKFDFRRGCRVKAVSQNKTAVAADAGPMHIQSREGRYRDARKLCGEA